MPTAADALATFTIRPIRASDDAAVAQIIRAVMPTFGAVGPGFAINDPEVDAMFTEYSKPRSTYLVLERARDDGSRVVVGGGGVAPLANARAEERDVCELKKMYFLDDVRGLGFGERMLTQLLDAARAHGFTRCYLETLKGMEAAQKLYRKLGFAPGCRRGDTGHFGCDTFYERAL